VAAILPVQAVEILGVVGTVVDVVAGREEGLAEVVEEAMVSLQMHL